MLERLQKIIARAGVASRRHAEQLILSGQVTLNGQLVTELGTKADSERDHIKVAGKLLRAPGEKIYVLLHKPSGVVATMSDPEGRPSLRDFLHGIPGRVFPVGRLEYHASGLLLLTNDGELASRVLRAHGLPQTYAIKIKGQLSLAETQAIELTLGVRLRRLGNAPNAWYEAALSGTRRNRLRPLLAKQDHPIEKMKRTKLGNLELDAIDPGQHRFLGRGEVSEFARAVAKALARPTKSGVVPLLTKNISKPPGRLSRRKTVGNSRGRFSSSSSRRS